MLNLLDGLIAYYHKEDKPALNINAGEMTSSMKLYSSPTVLITEMINDVTI